MNHFNLTGEKFGKLTVVKLCTSRDARGCLLWECRCDCGNTKITKGTLLNHNRIKSCGCLVGEVASKRLKGLAKKKHVAWKGHEEISGEHYTKIKHSASKRKIPFEITIQQMWEIYLRQNKKCALSGVELKFNSKQGAFDGAASLDRIDSTKAYIPENVQWIHKDLQQVKFDMDESIFFNWIKTIYNYKFV